MAGISFDVLRVGKTYRLTNFGEQYDFKIESIRADGNFWVKDIHTLEKFLLMDTLKFGRGDDFKLEDRSTADN